MATQSLRKTASKVTKPATDVAKGAKDEVLKQAVRGLVNVAADRAVSSAGKWVDKTTERLNDYASGDGGGSLLQAVKGGGGDSVKSGMVTGALKGGVGKIAEKVKNAFGGGGSKKGDSLKLTNIVEYIDIGADVHLVYDVWTQFARFPSFMKKVENVEQESPEKLTWKAQVFWSHRTWQSTIVEQVPFERIVWRSEGEKGSVDGAVTFHELAPNLTRVVVVLEYRPQGLFERTGNLWRAQGRRVRLELKHFQRQVMVHELLHPDEVEGWHGEIRDGEIVDEGDEDESENQNESEEDELDEDVADEEDEEEDEEDEEPEPRRRKVRGGAR